MPRPDHIQRFEEAFRSENPFPQLYNLAVSLRDEGVSQLEVYFLFEHFQIATSEEDPKHEAILNTMDLICGGPWAKGGDIFPRPLTNEEIRENREN